MLLNTLFLIYPTELLATIEIDILSVNSTNIWIVELILMVGFYNFMVVDTELKDTHSKPLVSGMFLLFLAMIIGIFLTDNYLFIVIFFICASILLNSIYYFGDRKQSQTRSMLRTHSIINGISYLLLLTTALIMYFEVPSFDFDIFHTYFPGASQKFQIIFTIGCFLGFGLPTGIVFITGSHFREFFDKANSIFLRLRFSLFIPLSGIVLIRVLAQVPDLPDWLNYSFHTAGLVGVIIFSFMILAELFGKSRQKTRSVPKILGLLGLLQGNLILLLGVGMNFVHFSQWDSYPSGDVSSFPSFYVEYLELILVIIFGNLLLVESISRVFAKNGTPDLPDLGGLLKTHPPFVVILVMAICVLICPGFFGFQYLMNTLPGALWYGASVLWINFGSFLLMVIVNLMVIGTFLTEIFLKPKKIVPSSQEASQPLNLLGPVFLLILVTFWSIFAMIISDLQIFLNWP